MYTTAVLMPYFLSDLVASEENYKDSFKLNAIVTGWQLVDNLHKKVVGVYTRA
jgi:hypothetical protein